MGQIRCDSCGALFTAQSDGVICPFCGTETGSKWGLALSALRGMFSSAMGFLFFMAFMRPSGGLLLSLIAVWAIAIIGAMRSAMRPPSIGSRKSEIITLGLGASSAEERQSGSYRLRPPAVPSEWATLVSTRPPREIYVPHRAWHGLLADAFLTVLPMGTFLARNGFQHIPLDQLLRLRADTRTFWLLSYLTLVAARAWQYASTREIVRDGEVTVAYTSEISKGAIWYQFRTATGDWFERMSPVTSKVGTFEGGELIPVFYIPQDPRKSVALCGTDLRVRLPEGEAQSGAGKMSIVKS
jgi:hypothetical protein